MTTSPTHDTYTGFDRAYAYFNEELFGGALQSCVITMQRRRKAYGYFHGGSWEDARGETVTDEIAMNPDAFRGRPTQKTLATLVHEMCHLWQHHYGTPSRRGYHNREWARKMDEVGLVPSDTGEEGGKRTGQKVSHYIQDGGPFDRACRVLLDSGFTIPWVAVTDEDDSEERRKKVTSKTKYSCPSCGTNIWGKPDLDLGCRRCNDVFTPVTRDGPEEEELC